VVFTDYTMLLRLGHSIRRDWLVFLERAYLVIGAALTMLWISGIWLVALKNDLDSAGFSPKLWTKLVAVGILTLTALSITRQMLPILRVNQARWLSDLTLRQ